MGTQHLIEQVAHGSPRACVGKRVIGRAGPSRRIDRGVGEAVLGAAIKVDPPVGAGAGHLGLELRALIGGHVRIIRAGADQDRTFDLARPGGPGGAQPAVETDHAADPRPTRAISSAAQPPKQKPTTAVRAGSTWGQAFMSSIASPP